MAYCKVAASRACNAALSYGEKRQGQEREGVVKNGVNCDIENAKTEMRSVRESWQKNGGVQAHVLNPFEGMKLSTGVLQSRLKQDASMYLTACGLAMRRFLS